MYLLYLLLLAGYIFSRGFYTDNSFIIMVIVIILFPIFLIKKEITDKLNLAPGILLIILAVLSAVLYGGLYQTDLSLVVTSRVFLAINILLAIKLIITTNKSSISKIFYLMIFLSLILRIFMVWSSPDPYIDVYDYLKKGALGFVSGQNPYSMVYMKMYKDVIPDFYSYLPGMIFLTLPFVLFFNDPRFAVIAAELLIAFIIYRICRKNNDRYIFPLLLLNNPISLYMVEQSYTEPIILFLLVLFAWSYFSNKRFAAFLSFGIALASKQYVVFLLPLIMRLKMDFKKILFIIFGAILTASVFIVPFYIWSPSDFWHDAVLLQLNFSPRYEGLTFFSFLNQFGVTYNSLVGNILIASGLIFVYTRRKITISQFFYLSSYTFLIIFFFNKWAFINYYYLISQLLLVGAILENNSTNNDKTKHNKFFD